MNVNCPTCGAIRTIYFDHIKGYVSMTCPKCSATTAG